MTRPATSTLPSRNFRSTPCLDSFASAVIYALTTGKSLATATECGAALAMRDILLRA